MARCYTRVMSNGKSVVFVACMLLIINSVVFYSDFHRHSTHLINSEYTESNATPRLSKIYRDLSVEFQADTAYKQSFKVLDALKRDGYNPVAVSEVAVDRSSLESTIACSNASSKQVTATPQNLSSDDFNQSVVVNVSSSDRRRQPTMEEKMNSWQVDLLVPNVVHYVFLGDDLTFTFANYLSYRSVERFIRPDQIFVHGDHTPSGKWWNRTIDEVKNIYHVKRNHSKSAPNGQPYKYLAHIADYMRTEILLNYGGIYMDADVLVVKSFTPLRRFPFVIGREHSDGLCNGIMLAERGAPFLRLLLEQYHSYLGPNEKWAEKSVLNVDKLARLYPHLVHIEETTLNRPNWFEREQIYNGRYNWTQNYAVHLWIRSWPKQKRPNEVKDILTRNTAFAELARLALFGSHEMRNNH